MGIKLFPSEQCPLIWIIDCNEFKLMVLFLKENILMGINIIYVHGLNVIFVKGH